jgi:hypothetical protein
MQIQYVQYQRTSYYAGISNNHDFIHNTNKTDRHDIAETLLKVALNTRNQTNQSFIKHLLSADNIVTFGKYHTI